MMNLSRKTESMTKTRFTTSTLSHALIILTIAFATLDHASGYQKHGILTRQSRSLNGRRNEMSLRLPWAENARDSSIKLKKEWQIGTSAASPSYSDNNNPMMNHVSRALRSSSGDILDRNFDNKEKSRLIQAYRISQYMYSTAAFAVLFMPDRTMSVLLASKWAGAAGFGIAAGLSSILAGACAHDRLNSDTYKRLNLGLLGFSLFGLSAIPGESGFSSNAVVAVTMTFALIIVKIVGAYTSAIGWKWGVKSDSIKEMMQDFSNGVLQTLKGLRTKDSKKALTYRNCLILVCGGMISSLMEGIFYMRYKTAFNRNFSWFDISLQWSAVSRLFMLSTMIYSLKDAAERDRLTGSTFIQMNIMVGVWALLSSLGQSIYPMGVAPNRGVAMLAFSSLFFLKALKSYIQKTEESKGFLNNKKFSNWDGNWKKSKSPNEKNDSED